MHKSFRSVINKCIKLNDELAKLAKPTLVITGTDDNLYNPHANALVIAGKIPGAWLVQFKNAGHAVMDQDAEEISKILILRTMMAL